MLVWGLPTQSSVLLGVLALEGSILHGARRRGFSELESGSSANPSPEMLVIGQVQQVA